MSYYVFLREFSQSNEKKVPFSGLGKRKADSEPEADEESPEDPDFESESESEDSLPFAIPAGGVFAFASFEDFLKALPKKPDSSSHSAQGDRKE